MGYQCGPCPVPSSLRVPPGGKRPGDEHYIKVMQGFTDKELRNFEEFYSPTGRFGGEHIRKLIGWEWDRRQLLRPAMPVVVAHDGSELLRGAQI